MGPSSSDQMGGQGTSVTRKDHIDISWLNGDMTSLGLDSLTPSKLLSAPHKHPIFHQSKQNESPFETLPGQGTHVTHKDHIDIGGPNGALTSLGLESVTLLNPFSAPHKHPIFHPLKQDEPPFKTLPNSLREIWQWCHDHITSIQVQSPLLICPVCSECPVCSNVNTKSISETSQYAANTSKHLSGAVNAIGVHVPKPLETSSQSPEDPQSRPKLPLSVRIDPDESLVNLKQGQTVWLARKNLPTTFMVKCLLTLDQEAEKGPHFLRVSSVNEDTDATKEDSEAELGKLPTTISLRDASVFVDVRHAKIPNHRLPKKVIWLALNIFPNGDYYITAPKGVFELVQMALKYINAFE